MVMPCIQASFSFVHDLEHMAKIASAIGEGADAHRYRRLLMQMKTAWHQAWFNQSLGCYGFDYYGTFTCGQTSNALGIVLGAAPPADASRVAEFLVADVLSHANHTTTGLIGWRNLLDALSAVGRDDLAWAVLTQKTYPSLGFEILNKLEPATTLW
jgi:alpha-L-rhamnosidase